MLEALGHRVENQHVVVFAARQLHRFPVNLALDEDMRVEELQHRHHLGDIPCRPWLGGLSYASDLGGSHGVHVVDRTAVFGLGWSLYPAQHPVRPGRAVREEGRDAGAVEQPQRRALAGRRVADV